MTTAGRRVMALLKLQVLVAVISVHSAEEPPMAAVSVRVVDETNAPVPGVSVHASSYWRPRQLTGVTDERGMFWYEDRLSGAISVFAEKEGWYKSGGEVWPGPRTLGDHPTNALTIVLKRVINPVPMIDKRIKMRLPRLSVPVAFDLVVGDWVGPDGKGTRCDVWITSLRRMTGRDDFEVSVTFGFTNGVDGIQEFWAPTPHAIGLASDLIPPQLAPEDGYAKSVCAAKARNPGRPYCESWRKDRSYVYRVRSTTNDMGAVEEANYGWIEGDFVIGPDEGGTTLVMFNYHHNPDLHSRSLEREFEQ